ncbi:MAG: hypothetical protein D6753_14415 [Planctomycetota bacterium]|nr:MAG: hypothetical protein D6753_14415 [Planctomycetota bacterium]
MDRLTNEEKAEFCLPMLIRAGLVDSPPTPQQRERLARVVQAAGDRIKIAGDILDYDYCFVESDAIEYDQAALDKRLIRPDEAPDLLREFALRLADLEPFDAHATEQALKRFVEEKGVKLNQVIHALRIAVTGRATGFGMFETLEILGKATCLARINKTLERVAAQRAQS